IELIAAVPGERDRLVRYYEEVLRIDPDQSEVRRALEPLYVRAGRFTDLAKMLEQAIVAAPPDDAEGIVLRTRLMRLYTGRLNEPERAAPHLEELLRLDHGNTEARTVAEMLLAHKGVAARAAASLAAAYEHLGKKHEAAAMLTVQLEYL